MRLSKSVKGGRSLTCQIQPRGVGFDLVEDFEGDGQGAAAIFEWN